MSNSIFTTEETLTELKRHYSGALLRLETIDNSWQKNSIMRLCDKVIRDLKHGFLCFGIEIKPQIFLNAEKRAHPVKNIPGYYPIFGEHITTIRGSFIYGANLQTNLILAGLRLTL